MGFTPDQWERVKELYDAVLACNASERENFLQAHDLDHLVCAEVRRLLREQVKLGSFLSTPPFAGGAKTAELPHNLMTGGEILAGRFRILEFIAAGGMGEVYKAEDTRLNRTVALKFLPKELAEDRASLERFRREARAASALNHPNICTIYDFGEDSGKAFISMEYLEGETLSARTRRGPLPIEEAVKIAVAVASALNAAHRKGIIHRDLKPGNVILTDTGAKLLDFGLAKSQRSVVTSEETVTVLIEESRVAGTLPYMSPEQLHGVDMDTRGDIFAFGAVLYEMLTGRRAFDRRSSSETIIAVEREEPPPIREVVKEVPKELEKVVYRCLRKQAAERYSSVVEIQRDLEFWLSRSSDQIRNSSASQTITGEKRTASSWRFVVPIVALAVILVAGWLYWHFHNSSKLTGRDTIVLTDFTNATGDSVFDGALREGLSVQLEQSPFLRIVSGQQIQQTLKMMNQKPDAKLTPELTREVCQRIGGAAVLDGSIAQIGFQYLLSLKAINCVTGESVASAQAQAKDKDHVADALGKTISEIRKKLGESLTTIQRFDTPLEQHTTPSLEALKAHSIGRALRDKGDCAGAISFYRQAITLDSTYALGYLSLGTCYSNEGEPSLGAENMRHAFELRANVSEQEKLWIESYYYLHVLGDLERAEQKLRVWGELYPREDKVPNSLGIMYDRLGDFGKAKTEYRQALELNPNSNVFRNNLVTAMIRLNHFEEAQALLDAGKAKNVDPYVYGYVLAFLRNGLVGSEQQTALFEKLERGDWLLPFRPDTAAYFGQLKRARTLSNLAVAEAKREHAKESWTQYEVYAALREALFGNKAASRTYANSALQSSNGRSVQYGAALALALIGDTDRVQSLADDLRKRFPDDTVVQRNCVPTLRAQVALNLKYPRKAIEILHGADPYELSEITSPLSRVALYPAYVRGMAYLVSRRGEEAAAEFQKILDHRGLVWNSPIGALAHLQIGRAYANQGDTTKARRAYQDFLALWQDADPNIPVLKAAKAEYASLH